ncbi:MAG: hypothetical protein ACE5F8_03775, partial [Woeseiaceae bacterium]
MVGWSFKSPAIIREFADYIIKGSHIDVLLKNPTQNQVDEIKALEQSKAENNGVTLIPEKNTTYELEADDCFVVLAEDELQPDRLQFRMTFILSAVALFLGPFLYALGQKTPTARQILDGFIFITIAGIVCVDIIPQSISNGGVYAFAFLVLGLAFPVVLEKNFRKAVPHAHEVVLLLAAIGLILHAAIDGIALLPL